MNATDNPHERERLGLPTPLNAKNPGDGFDMASLFSILATLQKIGLTLGLQGGRASDLGKLQNASPEQITAILAILRGSIPAFDLVADLINLNIDPWAMVRGEHRWPSRETDMLITDARFGIVKSGITLGGQIVFGDMELKVVHPDKAFYGGGGLPTEGFGTHDSYGYHLNAAAAKRFRGYQHSSDSTMYTAMRALMPQDRIQRTCLYFLGSVWRQHNRESQHFQALAWRFGDRPDKDTLQPELIPPGIWHEDCFVAVLTPRSIE